MKMNKKGIIENLQALIVPLVAIGIVLVIGFLIMAEAKNVVVDIGASTIFVNTTSLTWVNNTVNAFGGSDNCMSLSCPNLTNSTNNQTSIPTTLYSCGKDGVTIINLTGGIDSVVVITNAVCTPKSPAFNATEQVQNATQDIPEWLPIIIITIIGSLLIGLVALFKSKR